MKSASVTTAATTTPTAAVAPLPADSGGGGNVGRVRLLSHLSGADLSRQQPQQNRLDIPRPLTAKRRLSGADQQIIATTPPAPVGVEKPTIASQLRSSVGNFNFSNGSYNGGGLIGVVGDVGSRRRSQRMAPLLPFRLRTQQGGATDSNGGGSGTGSGEGARFGRLGNAQRPLSGAVRGGGAGRATNLCYYSGGVGAFGRNGVGIGAPYLPKSAAQGRRNGSGGGGNAGSRRASNSSGIGIPIGGNGGAGSTPGSRRSSQASIRSQGSSAGGGGGGRKKTNAPVPTMLIDVQIQLPQSRHWPKWQRDRIANSLFGNRPGEEQWITLDELDEKMRQLLLLRPQSAGKESMPPGGLDVSDEDSTSASPSRHRRRNQYRRASLRSRSPSPNGSNGSGGFQQQTAPLNTQHQQLLLRIKARQPATERQERPLTRRRPSISLATTAQAATVASAKQQYHNHHQQQQQATASGAQLASSIARRKGSHTGLTFPHRWPSARITSAAPQNATANAPANAGAGTNAATAMQLEQRSPARQDLNSQVAINAAAKEQNKDGNSESQTDNGKSSKQQQQQPQQQQTPGRRFHKVGFGRSKAGRLLKTVSEQRFSFLGAAAGGGRRGSTMTAIAAAAAAGNGSSATSGSAGNDSANAIATGGIKLASNSGSEGRICGDDPYTSQLRNRVHNAYYNPGPVDAAAAAKTNSSTLKIPGSNALTTSTANPASGGSTSGGKGSGGGGGGGATLTHSISTPSIVIDVAGADDASNETVHASADASNDSVGVVGRSTLAAASALRGRKAPIQSLLQVPGFY